MVRYYPDHHDYAPGDLAYLSRLACEQGLAVVTTEKDAVRLDPVFLREQRVLAVRIIFHPAGQAGEILREVLARCLPLPQVSPEVGEA